MWKLVYVLLFAAIATAEENGTHWVVVPTAVIPGKPLPVTVSFFNTTKDVQVRVDLIKDGHHLVTTNEQAFQKGRPGIIFIQVPDSLDYQSRYTLLVRGMSGLYFNQEAELRYDTGQRDEKLFIFIQTDKAVYKPGQTVRFRAFGVFSNMTVYTDAFNVSIYDPKNNKIKQWINVTNPEYGVIENYMVTDSEPLLGSWSIEVENLQMKNSRRKIFTLEKYVLPKFDAKLDLPPYILTSDKALTGKVNVKYTYGKPVTGTVLLKADIDYPSSPWKHHGDEAMVEINFNIKGESSFTVPLDRLVDEVDPSSYVPLLEKLAGHHLIITASVTEGLNNLTRNTTDRVRFYSEPYSVEFDRAESPSYFKPGLPYIAHVSIEQADGRPVISSTKDVEVAAYTKFFDRKLKNYRARVLWTKMFAPPSSGVLAIDVIPPLDTESLHLKVSFKDFTTTWTANKPGWFNPNGTFQLKQISEHATAGRNADFQVLSVHRISKVFFLVVANKMVLHTGSWTRQTPNSPMIISITVTRQMEPYAQLIVYHFMDNGTWSADSLYFNVNDGAMIFKNKVAMDFSRSSAEPGDDINLLVTTDPNSLVNVLAVDQSVILLKSGNDVTQKDVIDSLRTNKAPSGSSNYNNQHNPREIMQMGDIQVLTDVKGFSWAQPDYKQVLCEQEHTADFAFGPSIQKGMSMGMSMGRLSPRKMMAMDSQSLRLQAPPAPDIILKDVETIRTDFRETWLWTNVTSGPDGSVTISTKVPDTITSWTASAFSVNPLTGLGIAEKPAKLRTFRSFFVSLSLPYSVIRGEEIVLLVHVFNYMKQDLDVYVTLDKSSDFKVIVPDINGRLQYLFKTLSKSIKVSADSSETLFIPVLPVTIGTIDISVKAQSTLAADGVRRQLLVEPEGVRKHYNIPWMISSGATLVYPLKFPDTLVEGSQSIRVSAMGDIMGPTLENLHNLLNLPTGNAEMTMTNFAPAVYVANYLDITGQFKDDVRDKTIDFMEKGYQRMVTFQRPDGAFASWIVPQLPLGSGDIWLTAFVVSTFQEAKKYIFISDQVLRNAIEWLLNQQNFDGYFTPSRISPSGRSEGVPSSGFALTAYVLIALLKSSEQTNTDLHQRINSKAAKARGHLEANINNIQSTYDLAIVSYALRLSGSNRAATTYARLDKRASEKDGMKYWIDPRLDRAPVVVPPQRWFEEFYRPQSAEGVTIAGYAILYNVYSQHNPRDVLKIIKWIVGQRNEKGGFSSTRDTVVALEALSKYTALTVGPLDLMIDVAVGNYRHRLNVNRRDALVLKTTEVPKASIPNVNPTVQLRASGTGTALAQVSVSFNVEQEIVSPLFNLSVNVTQETLRSLVVEACFRPPSYSGATVLEFGIPSGFTVELSSPKTKREHAKKSEIKDKMVILYYDELPLSTPSPAEAQIMQMSMQQQQMPIQMQQMPIQQKVQQPIAFPKQLGAFTRQTHGQTDVHYKPICATLELIRTELVAKSRPVAVKLYEYENPDNRALVFYESKLLKQASFCDICPQCGCPTIL